MARTRGTPTYTDEQIIAALRETRGMVYLAAERLGCSPETVYTRIRAGGPVAEAVAAERGKTCDTAQLKLYQRMLDGEQWAVLTVLRTFGKDRGFGDSLSVEHTGPGGGPVVVQVDYRQLAVRDEPLDPVRERIDLETRNGHAPRGGG